MNVNSIWPHFDRLIWPDPRAYSHAVDDIGFAVAIAKIGSGLKKIPPDPTLPTGTRLIAVTNDPTDVPAGLARAFEETRAEFGHHAVRFGSIGAAASAERLVRQLLLAAYLHQTAIASGGHIRAAQLGELHERADSENSFRPERLLDRICAGFGTESPEPSRTWLAEIGRLRNCVVHRAGIVGLPGVAALRVRWSKPRATTSWCWILVC